MRSKREESEPSSSFIEVHRRRQIIDALIAEVAERGYAGASFDSVARRAKINKGVVLYYFKTKSDMVEAAVASLLEEMAASVVPAIAAEESAIGKLQAYIGSQLAFAAQHRTKLLALSDLLTSHRNPAGEAYLRRQTENTYLDSVEAVLRAGQKSGEFRPFEPRPMAIVLMNAINGALAQWALESDFPLEAYGQEVATIFDLATRFSAKGIKPRRASRAPNRGKTSP